MITGMINSASLKESADLRREIAEHPGIFAAEIRTCHILSESTMQGTDPSGTGEDSAVVNEVRYYQ